MKQTILDKAMRLMHQDYSLMSTYSNMFLVMSKAQEQKWENDQIKQYLQMGEKFLDFELERRSKLTEDDKANEALNWGIFGWRVEPKELAVMYMEWAHIPYDKKKLANL